MATVDRNGKIVTLETAQDVSIRKIFDCLPGRILMKILSAPFISRCAGVFMNSKLSTLLIDGFVKKNNIKMSEYEPCVYDSYNDFFTRKLKKGARKIDMNQENLISPADGKITVYKIDMKQRVKIKGSYYSTDSLLDDYCTAESFSGGYMAVIRLSVDNYHRYCYIDDAVKSDNFVVPGKLYTVNPAALEHVKVYRENTREYSFFVSKNFGRFIQMEVGALMVGKICNHHNRGKVKRGDEKGYFEFGGSSIVLLFQRDHVAFDEDIILNSRNGFETEVRMGEKIGQSVYR